jgi:phage terminase large subunit
LENETDPYYHSVYTLGNWGVLGDVIFTNWRVEDLSGMHDQFTNRRNGLDFGFSSDPAAAAVSHYDTKHKTIYVYKELYETGLTNDILAVRIKEMIGDERIICDSAEPKSIQELRNLKVNAVGAKKGKDSVNFGIDWLKRQTIIVDKSCINMQNELSQYHWKKDAGGNSTDTPVDKNNNLIDGGLRYAYEGDMEKGTNINPSAKVTNYTR